MVTRAGHTLVELLVALAFLGVAVGAIMTGTHQAYRATLGAVRGQHGAVTTAAVLDSLLLSPILDDGERASGALRTRWTVQRSGPGFVVTVWSFVDPDAPDLARVEGYWIHPPPVLPPGASEHADPSDVGDP